MNQKGDKNPAYYYLKSRITRLRLPKSLRTKQPRVTGPATRSRARKSSNESEGEGELGSDVIASGAISPAGLD